MTSCQTSRDSNQSARIQLTWSNSRRNLQMESQFHVSATHALCPRCLAAFHRPWCCSSRPRVTTDRLRSTVTVLFMVHVFHQSVCRISLSGTADRCRPQSASITRTHGCCSCCSCLRRDANEHLHWCVGAIGIVDNEDRSQLLPIKLEPRYKSIGLLWLVHLVNELASEAEPTQWRRCLVEQLKDTEKSLKIWEQINWNQLMSDRTQFDSVIKAHGSKRPVTACPSVDNPHADSSSWVFRETISEDRFQFVRPKQKLPSFVALVLHYKAASNNYIALFM